jgi:hypothetical protein
MVPRPIAVLALLYAALTAASAATLCRITAGGLAQSPVWPSAWLALSAGAMFGLALRREWGRRMASWTAWWMILCLLATAASLISAGRPGLGLAAGFGTTAPLLVARYLSRPRVKHWFKAEASGDNATVTS